MDLSDTLLAMTALFSWLMCISIVIYVFADMLLGHDLSGAENPVWATGLHHRAAAAHRRGPRASHGAVRRRTRHELPGRAGPGAGDPPAVSGDTTRRAM